MALTVKKWSYNKEYYGKAAVSKNNRGGNVYAFDTKGNFITLFKYASPGITFGMASGRAVELSNGITYYLITLKNKFKTYEFAYVSNQDFYFSAVRAKDEEQAKNDAQALFNALLESDKKLMVQINTRAALIDQLNKKGVDTCEYVRQLTNIVETFNRRQTAIKENTSLKIVNYFKLSGPDAIGILPLLIGVGIGAGIVLAGIVVYYFLKPEYNTSQLHSKYLSDNEAELKSKLGPEAYDNLKKNIDMEIKTNANEAYQEGKGEGTFGIIKNLGIAAVAIYAFTKISPR